ncbi:MAG: ABC transporter permease [Oscillospiraceae bacterium]|nr:ABC transporter permease [Oscillospiraceae bacterium]
MKTSMLRRSTLREIRDSLGRFLAIFGIIALGVGFFAGVRGTTPAMIKTVNDFYAENKFYDYRLVSTIGWKQEDVEQFAAQDHVEAAEGSQTMDALFLTEQDDEYAFITHSVTEDVNTLVLTEGRMPSAPDECVVDSGMDINLKVGDTIRLSSLNEKSTLETFVEQEFKADINFRPVVTVIGFRLKIEKSVKLTDTE